MTTSALKVRTPGDLAATVPHMLGFHPSDSLVVVGLRPPRSRVGPLVRLDLHGPLDDAALAAQAAGVLRGSFTETITILYGDPPDVSPGGGELLPRRRLMLEVDRVMTARGAPVRDAVLVADGRWWSYDCTGPGCCPPGGRPLASAEAPSPLTARLAVEVGMPLASRDDVVASLAPVVPPGFEAEVVLAVEALLRAGVPLRERIALLRRLVLAQSLRPGGASRADAARLIALVQDSHVRDAAIEDGVRLDQAATIDLWSLLLRWAPPGFVAQTAAVAAAVAYADARCALALTAVERALTADPGHRLSLLLMTGLQHGLPPATLRRPRRERRTRD